MAATDATGFRHEVLLKLKEVRCCHKRADATDFRHHLLLNLKEVCSCHKRAARLKISVCVRASERACLPLVGDVRVRA